MDLEFTHIGWHTGRSILLEVFVTLGITLVYNQLLNVEKKERSFDEEFIFGRGVYLWFYSQLVLPPMASSLESHTDSIMV